MKILIVDDKKENLYLLQRMLNKMGYEVVMAENGKQALEKLHGDNFTMVISDILMPVMDGYQLCQAVRNNKIFNDLFFIFYTATYVEEEDENFAFDLGADKFLRKPLEPEKFIKIIQNLIQKQEIRPVKPRKTIIKTDEEILKLYSERLINKLEKKIFDLEKETTRRKKVEEKIREHSKFLTDVMNSLTYPFYVINVKDYSIELANSAAKDINPSGVSTCYALTHKRDTPCIDEHTCPLEMVKKTKQSEVVEHIHYDKDGNPRNYEVHGYPIFDNDGNIIQMIEYTLDITKRMKAEETLRESEERYRTLFESTAEGILIADIQTKKFRYANPAMSVMLGYSREELKEMDVSGIHPKDKLEYVISEFEAQARGEKTLALNIPCLRKDGKIIYADINTTKASIDGKECNLGFFTDITERKKAEEELNNTLKDLKQSNVELEQFAYVASHDLQEPLRMVASFTQLLQNRYQDKLDDDANEFINYAVEGANRMQNLIKDLLIFSRVGSRGKPFKTTDMNAVLDAVIANLRQLIKETNTTITYKPLPVIIADESQMIQLLQNLVSNAIKFRSEESPRIHVSGEVQADKWIFSVNDNGIGIDSKYFDRIFVIFQRLHKKDKYGGTGIGLSVCKKIIQRHSGKIWVESELGKGSRFYFSIPKLEVAQNEF